MSDTEKSRAVVKRFLDHGWDREARSWDLEVIAETFDLDRYWSHTWEGNLAETGRHQARFFRSFSPDREILSEDLVADGDRVVHRVTYRTTATGNVLDIPATGMPITITHMEMWRVEGGKIVEHWGGIGEAQHLLRQVAPAEADEWPTDWADRMAGVGCEMCANVGKERTEYGIRFFDGRFGEASLQRAVLAPGYAVVVWKGRHVAEPSELSDEEATGYWREVLVGGRAIEAHFRPAKLNYQMLGNALPHLHTHILPRYIGDPAPGRPLPFVTAGRPPVPDDEIERQVTALRSLVIPDATGPTSPRS